MPSPMHRDLGQRVLADLVVDLLVAQIDLDAQAGLACGFAATTLAYSSPSEVIVVTTTCTGDEPEREVTGEVLDQDAEEALHRAADRAMHHDRRFFDPSASI
jgi:hypothetical protein